MCYLCLTNVQHSKNYFVLVKTTQFVVQAKQANENIYCAMLFNFFDIKTKKKVIQV